MSDMSNGVKVALLEGQLLEKRIDRATFIERASQLGPATPEASALAEKFIAIAADQSARRGKRPAPVLAASLDDKPRRPRAKVLLAVPAAAAASPGAAPRHPGAGPRTTAAALAH